MEVLEESLPLIMYKVTEMLRGFRGKEKTKLLFLAASLKASLFYIYSFKYHVIKNVLCLIQNTVITDDGSKNHEII